MAIHLEIRDRARPQEPHNVVFAAAPLALGRAPANDVPLPDPEVSSAHAQIVALGRSETDGTARLAVLDLGSANGTRIGGESVPPRRAVPVSPGQVISIGRYDIRLRVSAEPAPASARTSEVTARSLARGQLVAASGGPLRYLRIEDGPEQGRRLALDGTGQSLVVGSDPSASLRVQGVPARAARLEVDPVSVRLCPMGSGDAPRVDGVPLAEPHRLTDGETVSLGRLRLTFVDRSAELLGRMALPHATDALRPMGETGAEGPEGGRWSRLLTPALDAAAAVLGGAAVTAALVLIAWAVGL